MKNIIKNKKYILFIVGILLIISIILIIFIPKNKENNNTNDNKKTSLLQEVLKIKSIKEKDNPYKKITNTEVINEDTSFRNYAFITNNTVYVYDYTKLDKGEFVYKKVYDIPSSIKPMTIIPGYGASIEFIDYNDTKYTIQDNNTDNKTRNSYDMYLNANYSLSDYLKWEYSTTFLGRKLDYDYISSTSYFKDNTLYAIYYTNAKYPITEKISGNYEGETLIKIYNSKLLKTDKAFYEIIKYFDSKQNKTIYTTMKINLLTKYYDEVLNFTYKYVILKDGTIIPIKDIMQNRFHAYQENEYIDGPNYESEIPSVFEE